MLTILILALVSQLWVPATVYAQPATGTAEITPRNAWGPFTTTFGDVQIDVNRRGIAVRVEIPRDFLLGLSENDTHFIESDIRNDYYYYSVVDESYRWSYDWKGENSTAPCYKPSFSFRDMNAPYCVEIWNYLNGTFLNFTAPRFVKFHELRAPSLAGVYNFTLFVANHTNTLGYPDFVHAWNKTLFVPVSMKPNPGSISGNITDCLTDTPITAKGVVYAIDSSGTTVARAYVNQTTGFYNLTGLARGQSYTLEASAGLFRDSTGTLRSYSLTTFSNAGCTGSPDSVPAPNSKVTIRLNRAPQITGTIKFHDSRDPLLSDASPAFVANPWLKLAEIQALNLTVEAVDINTGYVFRNQSLSHTIALDPASERFAIMTGSGKRYVGLTPESVYGTEFAGLPQGGSFRLQVSVTGYSLRPMDPFDVPQQGGKDVGDVWLDSGGAIWGQILFVRDESLSAETPQQADADVGSANVFGGNILVEASDSHQTLRGLVIVNGTLPDGTIRYGSQTSFQFYIVGFSEYQNRTWAGFWNEPDDGLHFPDTYTINVTIRGYEQVGTVQIQFNAAGDRYPLGSPVPVYMKRGGAIEATVTSYNNRFGTRALQSVQPWHFLNLPIAVRARVYFYGPGCPHNECGYVERLMVSGISDGVGPNSFKVLFTGQNWSLREIWFYMERLTHISSGLYTVRAYTLGYVQQRDAIAEGIPGAQPTGAFVALLIGNLIGLTGSMYISPPTSGTTPISTTEHDHVTAQVFSSGSLMGATPGNLTTGIRTLIMPVYGFGGMTLNTTFTGLGHFFYVQPDGNLKKDYGLDVGNYTFQISEFGFTKHFMQLPSPLAHSFGDLSLQSDSVVNLIAMGIVWHGGDDNLITTDVDTVPIPLSWIQVEAVNGSLVNHCSDSLTGSIDRCVPSMDGAYDGIGALFLPAGTYTIILTDTAGFCSSTSTPIPVGWNSKVFPGNSSLTCTDPPSPSPAGQQSMPTNHLGVPVFSSQPETQLARFMVAETRYSANMRRLLAGNRFESTHWAVLIS